MSEKDNLLNNNNNDKKKDDSKVKQTKAKVKTSDNLVVKKTTAKATKKTTAKKVNLASPKDSTKDSNLTLEQNQKQDINNDELINVELYNEILSTLFNSLSNPIVRNEIKVNENILKYIELQISNLFFLETELAEKIVEKKMAKEFLQLIANITNLALSVTKSPKKTRIEILEDRNLLIVTIINSCKGIERENLERIRVVNSETLKSLNNQIAALSDFTTEETFNSNEEGTDLQKENNLGNLNNQGQTNNLNNSINNTNNLNNIKNLNNMANLSKLGILPQHPASNSNFYPYLTKPVIIPKLKKVLSGMLIFSSLFIIMTMITTLFVKGKLQIDVTKDSVNFVLSQTNNWMILIMTIVLYFSFAYIFMKPSKILREKYHLSYFMLGLLFFWLIVTISYFFWGISDSYYENFFLAFVKKEEHLNENLITDLKNLPNFQVFRGFAISTAAVCILPLVIVLVLILINPRLDRNKVIRANSEYQNAVTAALNGQKYDIDPSLFDYEDLSSKTSNKKRRKANFSGRF